MISLVWLTGLADGLALKESRYARGDSPHLLVPPPLAVARTQRFCGHANKLSGGNRDKKIGVWPIADLQARPVAASLCARKASQEGPSFGRVPRTLQNGQASWASSRPDQGEPTDLREVLTSWLPSTGSDGAVQTLDRLPGLARANEAWEPNLTGAEQPDPEPYERALLHVRSCASLDGLDADEPEWQGPDGLALALERQFG